MAEHQEQFATKQLLDLLRDVLRPGFFGEATIKVRIQDGVIQTVEARSGKVTRFTSGKRQFAA